MVATEALGQVPCLPDVQEGMYVPSLWFRDGMGYEIDGADLVEGLIERIYLKRVRDT